MILSLLFAIGLAQGVFLTVIFCMRKKQNRLAHNFLMALLLLFVLSNWDDLLLSTSWYQSIPALFGYSVLAIFAYGPLFYLYIRAVTDPEFRWQRTNWLHFLPALVYFLLYFPVLSMPSDARVEMLNQFLAGAFTLAPGDLLFSIVRIAHLATYVWLAVRLVNTLPISPHNASLRVPLPARSKWMKALSILFSLILLALVITTVVNIWNGRYLPGPSFAFTLATSSIMYFMAYKLMFQPESVTPGFQVKYASVRSTQSEESSHLRTVIRLLEEEQIYTDTGLKLGVLAERLNLSSHQLSMLINENFGQSFSDLINRHRVDEFIRRLNDPQFAHLTLYGLALEVGFNSKSAFNAAFKKMTGKTPSEYRKSTI